MTSKSLLGVKLVQNPRDIRFVRYEDLPMKIQRPHQLRGPRAFVANQKQRTNHASSFSHRLPVQPQRQAHPESPNAGTVSPSRLAVMLSGTHHSTGTISAVARVVMITAEANPPLE